jgi:hypothetical protein
VGLKDATKQGRAMDHIVKVVTAGRTCTMLANAQTKNAVDGRPVNTRIVVWRGYCTSITTKASTGFRREAINESKNQKTLRWQGGTNGKSRPLVHLHVTRQDQKAQKEQRLDHDRDREHD